MKIGGIILDKFEKVTHNITMMSLIDVFNEDEIIAMNPNGDEEIHTIEELCPYRLVKKI
ncbi:MAG: hypothetical protein J5634_04670 [Bacilli bacterium]|nr:hypothetical protein [Bacilli bacterium]